MPPLRALAGGSPRMRPILAVALVLPVVATGCLMLAPRPDVPPGRFRQRTVTLILEGTPGLAFEGSYGTPSSTTPARGTTPAQYVVETSVAVIASFTKGDGEGELVVRVLVDGKEVQRRSTAALFGTIVISHRFSP